MIITLNGNPFKLEKAISVAELVQGLQLDMRKIAIEKNLEIVPRSQYSSTKINDDDRIEIVSFIGGG